MTAPPRVTKNMDRLAYGRTVFHFATRARGTVLTIYKRGAIVVLTEGRRECWKPGEYWIAFCPKGSIKRSAPRGAGSVGPNRR